MNTKEKILERLHQQLNETQDQINFINDQTALEQLELNANFFGGILDFDNLKHDDVIHVIKAFGGKWDKTPADNGTVHYETKVKDKTVRCYQGEPPPNCKVIEVLVEIPAQPAKTITQRKLVCQ